MTIGLNISGGEFGDKYGTHDWHYHYPSFSELEYYSAKGVDLVRIPMIWERLQGSLGGPLNLSGDVALIKQILAGASALGMNVILDVHSFARYDGVPIGAAGGPTAAQFADFWKKMAIELKDYPSVVGYDLANEPHDMPVAGAWKAAAQAATDAIRTVDMETVIYIEGEGWSGSHTWLQNNSDLIINDPANRIVYQAHGYYDKHNTGFYEGTYEAENGNPMIGVERLRPFVEWLEANNLTGMIGEFGAPSDDPRWLEVQRITLDYMQAHNLEATAWGGGTWWGTNYDLYTAQPGSPDSAYMDLLQEYFSEYKMPQFAASGRTGISDTTPTEGQVLTANPGTIQDSNGTTKSVFTYAWQTLNAGGWTTVASGANLTLLDTYVGKQLRVVASFTDDLGSSESVTSLGTGVVGDRYVGTAASNMFVGNEGQDDASGGGGADNLSGLGGNDTLSGGNGIDTLDGGAGQDRLIGGAGSDIYVVDNLLDVVTELAGQGTDTVQTVLTSYTLGATLENLTYTGAAKFTGTGNGLTNIITSGVGNDVLDGGAGFDKLIGGAGDDAYYVDNAADSVVEAIGAGTDTVYASVQDTLSENVENLVLTGSGNIGGTGNNAANIITGNAGNNALSGSGGDDQLFGGFGVDNLNGGAGNDILLGGAGNDTLNGGTGIDAFYGGGGDDILIGSIENETFFFEAAFGADQIRSFDSNPVGGQDLISLSALRIGQFSSDVMIAASGANTVITIGENTITLINVAAATISEADFIL